MIRALSLTTKSEPEDKIKMHNYDIFRRLRVILAKRTAEQTVWAALLTLVALLVGGGMLADASGVTSSTTSSSSVSVSPTTQLTSGYGPIGNRPSAVQSLMGTPKADQFVVAVRSQMRYWSYGGDDDSGYVKLGVSMCQGLDRNVSYSYLLSSGLAAGYTWDESTAIVNSSITYLCPMYSNVIF